MVIIPHGGMARADVHVIHLKAHRRVLPHVPMIVGLAVRPVVNGCAIHPQSVSTQPLRNRCGCLDWLHGEVERPVLRGRAARAWRPIAEETACGHIAYVVAETHRLAQSGRRVTEAEIGGCPGPAVKFLEKVRGYSCVVVGYDVGMDLRVWHAVY